MTKAEQLIEQSRRTGEAVRTREEDLSPLDCATLFDFSDNGGADGTLRTDRVVDYLGKGWRVIVTRRAIA